MTTREHILTIVFACFFAVLIWLWAEGENRETQVETFIVQVLPSDPDAFLVRIRDPGESGELLDRYPIEVTLEGPATNIARVTRANQELKIRLGNLQNERARLVDLVQELTELQRFVDEGITVQRVTPATLSVRVDALETRSVPVSTSLDGYDIESITATPDRVDVRAPLDVWETYVTPSVLASLVRLDMPKEVIDNVPKDQPTTRNDIGLALHPLVATQRGVTITPETVTVELTVANRVAETRATIPVKVLLLPQDEALYEVDVEIEQRVIRDVVVTGHPDAIDQLNRREVSIYAVVNLSSDDLEQGITSKQVEWFIEPANVELTVQMPGGQPDARPTVPLLITPRQTETP